MAEVYFARVQMVPPVKSQRLDQTGQSWLKLITGPDQLALSGPVWIGPRLVFIEDGMTAGMRHRPTLAKNRTLAIE